MTPILNAITEARSRFIRQNDTEPRYLVLGPAEWERFRIAVAESGVVHRRLLERPQEGPEGWDSGVDYAEMRVVVFERPQITCRNNLRVDEVASTILT